MTPLAAAVAAAIADAPHRRVPLAKLLAAAAAVDRTGAVAVGWRSRIADAIKELAAAGIIEVPRTRWDTHQEILGPGAWLIIENWTTYRTLVDAARRNRWDGRLVWGAGNQVATHLTSLVATEGVPANGLLYFGDIDTAGFRIARMAASRAEKLAIGELRPAVALYRVCCDAGTIRTTANRAAEELQRWTRDWLGGTLGRVTAEIIADGGRIVQETVGVELLNSVETDRLLPE